MAFKNSGENLGELKEEYFTIWESERSDTMKGLISVSWSGKEPRKELRMYNKSLLKEDNPRGWKTGMALTEEELEILATELVRMGYGDSKEISKILKSRD